MDIKFIVTIVHNNEIVDWTWDSNPDSENYGEEYPIYEDQPFYGVEMVVDGKSTTLSEIPNGSKTKDVDYVQCNSVKEVAQFFDDEDIVSLLWRVIEALNI